MHFEFDWDALRAITNAVNILFLGILLWENHRLRKTNHALKELVNVLTDDEPKEKE